MSVTNIFSEAMWFTRTSLRNRSRTFISRIKSPKYAIALLLSLLYFGSIIFAQIAAHGATESRRSAGPMAKMGSTLFPLAMGLLVASWWLWRTDVAGIALTPAETNMLVPAPLTRRQLMQFKLLREQPRLMLSGLFMAIIYTSALPFWALFLSGWCLSATLLLHRYGASLVHTNLAQHGRSGWRRVWLATLVFAAMLGAVVYALVDTFLVRHVPFTFLALSEAFRTPPAGYALAPFRAVLAPLLATDVNTWLNAFGVALAIAFVHYRWVIRTDAAFEEGAAAAGVKRAAVLEAARAGQTQRAFRLSKPDAKVRAAWFPLAPVGAPAVAVLWKNALSVTRGMSRRVLSIMLSVAILIVMFSTMQMGDKEHPMLDILGHMAIAYSVIVTLIAPYRIRHDFRSELMRMDLFRTLPVGGASLAAAEIATSAIMVSLIQLALAGTGVGCLIAAGKITNAMRFSGYALPIIVAVVGLNTTMVAAYNWIALRYPAWVSRPAGIEMFGMAMISILGGAVMLAVFMIIPLITGGVMVVRTGLQLGGHAWIPGAIGVIAGIYGQLLFIVVMVGHAYDRMDTAERIATT